MFDVVNQQGDCWNDALQLFAFTVRVSGAEQSQHFVEVPVHFSPRSASRGSDVLWTAVRDLTSDLEWALAGAIGSANARMSAIPPGASSTPTSTAAAVALVIAALNTPRPTGGALALASRRRHWVAALARTDPAAVDATLLLAFAAAASYKRASTFPNLPGEFCDATGGVGSSSLERFASAVAALPSASQLCFVEVVERLPAAEFAALFWLLSNPVMSLCSQPRAGGESCYSHRVAAVWHVEQPFHAAVRVHPLLPIQTAYHGSSLENWVSIMNGGLRNMSNTPRMRNGAVWGDAIYLSTDVRVSHEFASFALVGGTAEGGRASARYSCVGEFSVLMHEDSVTVGNERQDGLRGVVADEVPRTYVLVRDPRLCLLRGLRIRTASVPLNQERTFRLIIILFTLLLLFLAAAQYFKRRSFF
eukprot:gnl/Spiro4/316_TR198_c0_g1_i1.p1 gnl/Spiro4/316_TR198_c0_g1~~gnl/Spiro4/316_TR198_c0_g1_i1.p1  ORF type:complete len:419 (-),score=70.04 gnl/Spiro4/316_TR198_c0_g1_i1:201-1457(-)